MQEQVYQTPIHYINDPKQRLLDVWAALDHSLSGLALELLSYLFYVIFRDRFIVSLLNVKTFLFARTWDGSASE